MSDAIVKGHNNDVVANAITEFSKILNPKSMSFKTQKH
jgi:hypothetical protein